MFVNNSRIFGPNKILLITLDQGQLESVRAKFHADRSKSKGGVRKSRFCSFRDFAEKNSRRKWAWPSPFDSAQFKESGDIRFLNVRHTVWEL